MGQQLIGLDWGTSSLRAYLIEDTGTIIDRREASAGILTVENGAFEAVFRDQVGDWLGDNPDAALLASGMITSRQGWRETPFVFCPAGREEIADALVAHHLTDGRKLHFVTGVALADDTGIPDVMRGEETQIVGAFGADVDAIAVMPGSHSKWVRVENGRITGFSTFMTGEVYAALIKHTILGRVVENAREDEAAFYRGLELGLDQGGLRGGLLGRLFSARTLVLFDRLDADSVPSYVSGLVLGTEIIEAQKAFGVARSEVTVIGGDSLAGRYVEVLAKAGVKAKTSEPDRAAFGLLAIARAKGLM